MLFVRGRFVYIIILQIMSVVVVVVVFCCIFIGVLKILSKLHTYYFLDAHIPNNNKAHSYAE